MITLGKERIDSTIQLTTKHIYNHHGKTRREVIRFNIEITVKEGNYVLSFRKYIWKRMMLKMFRNRRIKTIRLELNFSLIQVNASLKNLKII